MMVEDHGACYGCGATLVIRLVITDLDAYNAMWLCSACTGNLPDHSFRYVRLTREANS